MLQGVWKVWGNEPSNSQGNSPLWEMEFRWTPKFSESNCKGQNSIAQRVLYIIANILEHRCLRWLILPVWTSETQVWPKEGLGMKLTIWLMIIKSWEPTLFRCMQVACDMSSKSSRQGLQLFFKPHLNLRFARKVMGLKNCRSPNFSNFETLIWEAWDKKTFGCGPRG